VQSDGSVVAADETMVFVDGVNYVGNKNTVVRFTPNGAVDTNFGSNGFVAFDGVYYSQTADGIAVGNDDKILIGTVEADPNSGNASLVLNRLSNDGSVASSTMAPIDLVWINEAAHVTVAADGSIYLAGAGYDDVGAGTAVARFTSNGDLDSTFGNSGTMWTRDVPAEKLSGLLPMSDGSVAVSAGGSTWRLYQSGSSTVADEIVSGSSGEVGLADGGSGVPLIVQPMPGRLGFGHFAANKAVVVNNVQPTATLVIDNESPNGLTASVINPSDPSTADTVAGFRYSFATEFASLADSYAEASSSSSVDFEFTAGSHDIWARIFDKDGYKSCYNTTVLLPTFNWQDVGTDHITIAWADIATGETGWRIQRSTDGSNWDWYHNVAADSTSYNDTSVTDGTRYWYRVRAYGTLGTAGDTAYSPKDAQSSKLAAPNQVTLSPGVDPGTSIISWQDNSQHETGYTIEQSIDGAGFGQVGTVNANVTSFTVGDISSVSQYAYRIHAIDDDQTSVNAAGAPIQITPVPINDAAVPVPLNGEFVWDRRDVTDKQKVVLSFNVPVTVADASHVLLENLTSNTQIPIILVASGTTLAVRFPSATSTQGYSGVLPDGNYQLRIFRDALTNAVGDPMLDDYSGEFFFLGADADRNRVVDDEDLGAIALSWTVGSGKTFSQGDFSYDGAVNVSDVLALGQQWEKELKEPEPLSVWVPSTTQIYLSWADTATSETGWTVLRSTDGINFAVIEDDLNVAQGNLGPDVTDFEDTWIDEGVTYWYQIRANGNGQEVIASAKRSATGGLVGPVDVSISELNATSVHLTWADEASGEDGYLIYRSDDNGNSWTLVGDTGPDETEFDAAVVSWTPPPLFKVEPYIGASPTTPSASTPATPAEVGGPPRRS
jgi:hypothetical protein